MERQVEHRAYEYDQREYDNHAAYDLVDDHDAAVVELVSYLVYQPRKSEPPQQCSAYYAEITNAHVQRMLRYDEGELGVGCHEQEYDQRVGECYEKGRYAVVYQRAFLISADVDLLRRV